MWFEEFVAVVHSIGVTVVKILPVSIALGAAFTVPPTSLPAIRASRGGASASL